MNRTCILLLLLLLISLVDCCYAQVPSNPIPKITLPNQPNLPTVPSSRSIYPQNSNSNFNSDAQRAVIMREVQAHQQQMQRAASNHISGTKNDAQRQADINMLVNSGFPSQAEYEGTTAFYNAFEEINDMLKGNRELDLARAVFLAENAFHNNKYDYNDYKNAIKRSVNLCSDIIEEEKLDKNDNLAKNMMLFRFICDTLKFKDKTTNKNLTHYPIKYNYDDYQSKISYDSHFVTTLMRTGTGQCHSMPLYYLILAEEMGADAYWSFSPRHSFVKIQDERGIWYNLELTCKAILSDTHYMNSSYIKAEALRNKLYLEPLDKTNVIAQMLVELARGYYEKYGLDDFYLKCADTAMKYLDNDLDPLMLKSIYQTRLTLTLAHLLNAPKPDMMKQLSPDAYKHYELMQAQYKQIDDMGYEEIPIAIYGLWLDHIAKEKEKADKAKLPSIFIKIPTEQESGTVR